MRNNPNEKRLYYLRRYNRLYKDQILLLEEQIGAFNQQEKELRQQNKQLKNELYVLKALITNAVRARMQQEQFMRALHRPSKENIYSNGLGKESIVHMNEENDKHISLDPSTNNSSIDELHQQIAALQEKLNTFEQQEEGKELKQELEHEDVDPKEKKPSAIVQQIKNYEKKRNRSVEQTSQPTVYKQTDKKERVRSSPVTFRDIQRAHQIHSKPRLTMGCTRSSVNRKMNNDKLSTNAQDESHIPKTPTNHKAPVVKEDVQENEKKDPDNEGEQPHEEVSEFSKPLSNHTSSTTTHSPDSVQRTIQPRQSGKNAFLENNHQPSFFKSLLNKLK